MTLFIKPFKGLKKLWIRRVLCPGYDTSGGEASVLEQLGVTNLLQLLPCPFCPRVKVRAPSVGQIDLFEIMKCFPV